MTVQWFNELCQCQAVTNHCLIFVYIAVSSFWNSKKKHSTKKLPTFSKTKRLEFLTRGIDSWPPPPKWPVVAPWGPRAKTHVFWVRLEPQDQQRPSHPWPQQRGPRVVFCFFCVTPVFLMHQTGVMKYDANNLNNFMIIRANHSKLSHRFDSPSTMMPLNNIGNVIVWLFDFP